MLCVTSCCKKAQKLTSNNAPITFIADTLEVSNADALRKICVDCKNEIEGNYLICLTANIAGKPFVAVSVNEGNSLDCSKIIKEHIAPLVKGGGGGNKTLATAGGQDANTLAEVMDVVKALL